MELKELTELMHHQGMSTSITPENASALDKWLVNIPPAMIEELDSLVARNIRMIEQAAGSNLPPMLKTVLTTMGTAVGVAMLLYTLNVQDDPRMVRCADEAREVMEQFKRWAKDNPSSPVGPTPKSAWDQFATKKVGGEQEHGTFVVEIPPVEANPAKEGSNEVQG